MYPERDDAVRKERAKILTDSNEGTDNGATEGYLTLAGKIFASNYGKFPPLDGILQNLCAVPYNLINSFSSNLAPNSAQNLRQRTVSVDWLVNSVKWSGFPKAFSLPFSQSWPCVTLHILLLEQNNGKGRKERNSSLSFTQSCAQLPGAEAYCWNKGWMQMPWKHISQMTKE